MRIVLLANPGWRWPGDDLPVEFCYVESGYEAAAELLANPGAALAADLGCLGQHDMALLDLAARLNRVVVAFGTISQSIPPQQLARIHLTSREQLVQTLTEVLAEPAMAAAMRAGGTGFPACADTPSKGHATSPVERPPSAVDSVERAGLPALEPQGGTRPQTTEPRPTLHSEPGNGNTATSPARAHLVPRRPIQPADFESAPKPLIAPVRPPAVIRPIQTLTQEELDALLEEKP